MVIRKTIVAVVAVGVLALGLQAQAQKNWKDRAEYDLYTEITKDNVAPAGAAARLPLLEKWKASYPQSEYADVRQKIYLVTYQQQNNHRAAFDLSNELLKADPNDQTSLQEILGYVRSLMPAQANAALSAQNKADLESAEKSARYVLTNADNVYGPAKKPQGVDDATWAKTKPAMTNFSQATLCYIGSAQKDTGKAEAECTKALQADPASTQSSTILASTLLSQQKDHPEKMPLALYQYAHLSAYDGPGALDAAARKKLDTFFNDAYKQYHGSPQGADQVKMVAKTNPLPPADWAGIKSTIDIMKEQQAAKDELAKENPSLGFWLEVKEGLTGDPAYWGAMKGAGLPPKEKVPSGKFTGKLISATPETKPKELKIAIEKPDVADVTLVLAEPLPGKMDPGGDISFFGEAQEFAEKPFMVTFKVDKEDIEGWTGKDAPGAPARRPAGATKKGIAKKQ